MINGIEDLGGIEAAAARWQPETKTLFVSDLDALIATFTDWKLRLGTPPNRVDGRG